MFETTRRPLGGLLIGLLATGLAASAEAGQWHSGTPAPQEAAQELAQEEAEETTRSARRILHLAHGGTLRTVARQSDGVWEFQRDGEWIALDPGLVTRAPKEAEVLRESKRRKKALKKDGTLDDRVALASWMIEEGLAKESLRELDLVLEESPHHGGALALLRGEEIIRIPSLDVSRAELPAAQEQLMRWAVQAPVAAREIAIVELDKLADREQLHADLLEALGAFSLRRRVFAAQAIGRAFPGQEVKRLLQHAVLDSSSAVRRSAAEALGSADDASLIVPVVRALDSSNARVRTQAAEALGFMGYAAAVEPLMGYMSAAVQSTGENRVPHGYVFFGKQTAYVQDFDVEVATFQAVADPQINVLLEGDVLEAGVIGSTLYSSSVEASAARSSLSRLTGQNPGHSARSWKRWWQSNQKDWTTAQAAPVGPQ